jgi:F-box protein, helicase, 18
MELTREQILIVESDGNIKINAVAGSGKTATLIEYARARQGKGKILYLAFNKSVRIEAVKRFSENGINNVQVETAHSLAYAHIVKGSSYKVRTTGGYKTNEIVEILRLKQSRQKHTEFILASHINKFLTYFCNSSKLKVQELNYEDVVQEGKARQFVINQKEELLRQTRIFLDKMNKGEIEITHDFYLKKFQQKNPELPFDYILFDESQDASEAMLDVFLRQKAVKVAVGDTHQQIYGWRYAINSLEKVDFPTFLLTTSFRFDNEIASLAMRVLNWKTRYQDQGSVLINGCGGDNSGHTKAIIARTNTALLVKAIEMVIEKEEVQKIYFEGRIESYTYADDGASIYDVLNLYQGNRKFIKDKMIASMQGMDDLEEYIEKTGDAQLALIVEVVKKYLRNLPSYIKRIKECHIENDDKKNAEMIFSTVHRCKGMEYDEVTLANDFINEGKISKVLNETGKEKQDFGKLSEEINLLYVAITRTKNKLNIPIELLPASKINILLPTTVNRFDSPYKKFNSYDPWKRKKETYAAWGEEDDDQLTILFCEGRSIKEIGKLIGRRERAIRTRIEKLELMEKYF